MNGTPLGISAAILLGVMDWRMVRAGPIEVNDEVGEPERLPGSGPSGTLHEVAGPITFRGRVEHWDPEAGRGLAVMLIPDQLVDELGGLRQFRVRGTINGRDFASSAMVRKPRRLCFSLSKAILSGAGLHVGDEADVTLEADEGPRVRP